MTYKYLYESRPVTQFTIPMCQHNFSARPLFVQAVLLCIYGSESTYFVEFFLAVHNTTSQKQENGKERWLLVL
jgi:hypothetical protein